MISVLFARRDSVYKCLCDDVWDIERDARNWPGGNPVVAHPPCRAWGGLSHMAKPRPDEKELAIFAVRKIREFGGVLEHPKTSRLWDVMRLPAPGDRDCFGGFTLCVDQFWWGHKARKATFLYVVGCEPKDVPTIPMRLDAVEYTVASKIKKYSGRRTKKEISKKEREATPVDFAKWLIELANKCKKHETI